MQNGDPGLSFTKVDNGGLKEGNWPAADRRVVTFGEALVLKGRMAS